MYENLTKAEIIEQISARDAKIAELEQQTPQPSSVPEHDFYRAVMLLECISCGARYVDVVTGDKTGCTSCKAGTDFVAKYRSVYQWASDRKDRDHKAAEKKQAARVALGLKPVPEE